MLDEANLRFVDKGRIIKLTFTETKILLCFIRNKKNIITHEMIADAMGYITIDAYILPLINTHVCNLRQKLHSFIEIKSARPLGYRIRYIGED